MGTLSCFIYGYVFIPVQISICTSVIVYACIRSVLSCKLFQFHHSFTVHAAMITNVFVHQLILEKTSFMLLTKIVCGNVECRIVVGLIGDSKIRYME